MSKRNTGSEDQIGVDIAVHSVGCPPYPPVQFGFSV